VDCPADRVGKHSSDAERRSVKAIRDKKPDRQRPAGDSILCTSAEENEDLTMPGRILMSEERVGDMQGCGVSKPYIYSARLVKF
jgi:hypothetical protein